MRSLAICPKKEHWIQDALMCPVSHTQMGSKHVWGYVEAYTPLLTGRDNGIQMPKSTPTCQVEYTRKYLYSTESVCNLKHFTFWQVFHNRLYSDSKIQVLVFASNAQPTTLGYHPRLRRHLSLSLKKKKNACISKHNAKFAGYRRNRTQVLYDKGDPKYWRYTSFWYYCLI